MTQFTALALFFWADYIVILLQEKLLNLEVLTCRFVFIWKYLFIMTVEFADLVLSHCGTAHSNVGRKSTS